MALLHDEENPCTRVAYITMRCRNRVGISCRRYVPRPLTPTNNIYIQITLSNSNNVVNCPLMLSPTHKMLRRTSRNNLATPILPICQNAATSHVCVWSQELVLEKRKASSRKNLPSIGQRPTTLIGTERSRDYCFLRCLITHNCVINETFPTPGVVFICFCYKTTNVIL